VLIHGGCHGAWCWERVLAHLPAVAINLPGHGRNVARAGLADGIAAVCDAIEAIGEPVVLVGHSLGGMTISGVAEAIPERISRLIYLSALLPFDGESAATIPMPTLGAVAAATISPDGHWTGLDSVLAPPIFYQDCDRVTVDAALSRIGRTDLDYVITPVHLSGDRFGSVPKTYIHCLQDRAIQREAQAAMTARYPGTGVAMLDSGHSPFLSMPERLAAMLLDLV